MIIRRNNSNTLSIESTSDKAQVVVKSLDGQLLVKVSGDGGEVELAKPGDYEYFGVSITGLENPLEKYTGVINILKVTVEDIRIVLLLQIREINKEILNNLANIDILAIPIVNPTATKNVVNDVEPKKVVLVKSFSGGEEVELESVKKALGIQTMEEFNSSKSKAADFASLGDDFILTGEILA